jgi:hypothetical protein
MMASTDGFDKFDSTPFGVFICPSKELSGSLLVSFKIHLRFSSSDPLPQGLTCCKDFWEDEELAASSLGYNWGFSEYFASVTAREFIDKTSPCYQLVGGRPSIIVEASCFFLCTGLAHLMYLAAVSQNMQGL